MQRPHSRYATISHPGDPATPPAFRQPPPHRSPPCRLVAAAPRRYVTGTHRPTHTRPTPLRPPRPITHHPGAAHPFTPSTTPATHHRHMDAPRHHTTRRTETSTQFPKHEPARPRTPCPACEECRASRRASLAPTTTPACGGLLPTFFTSGPDRYRPADPTSANPVHPSHTDLESSCAKDQDEPTITRERQLVPTL